MCILEAVTYKETQWFLSDIYKMEELQESERDSCFEEECRINNEIEQLMEKQTKETEV